MHTIPLTELFFIFSLSGLPLTHMDSPCSLPPLLYSLKLSFLSPSCLPCKFYSPKHWLVLNAHTNDIMCVHMKSSVLVERGEWVSSTLQSPALMIYDIYKDERRGSLALADTPTCIEKAFFFSSFFYTLFAYPAFCYPKCRNEGPLNWKCKALECSLFFKICATASGKSFVCAQDWHIMACRIAYVFLVVFIYTQGCAFTSFPPPHISHG